MIYRDIRFKADPFLYELHFDDRITLVGGDSGTGKTVLYEMLEDLKLTKEYHAIKLFNYKSDSLVAQLKKCRNNFIVIDNADILMTDDIRRFINFEFSNQYMLFSRNCVILFSTYGGNESGVSVWLDREDAGESALSPITAVSGRMEFQEAQA